MLTLDYRSGQPIYEQIYRQIIRLVSLGVLQPNEQLPTVRALAQELGINPNTVQKSYQRLEQEHIIYSITGKGSFIAPDLSAVTQHRAMAEEKLIAALRDAAESGLSRQDVETIVDRYYEQGGERHD